MEVHLKLRHTVPLSFPSSLYRRGRGVRLQYRGVGGGKVAIRYENKNVIFTNAERKRKELKSTVIDKDVEVITK